jgi:hypothetical protein
MNKKDPNRVVADYRKLTDRDAVLRALQEFDRLERDQFLSTYGFKRARTYFLRHGDRDYDSKAIAGVAHGMALLQLLCGFRLAS